MSQPAQIGVIGMAVMGRNLALNLADHGFGVIVHNRTADRAEAAVAESGGRLKKAETLEALVRSLQRPRRVLLMVKAGEAVDAVLGQLKPLLEEGDIVVDGGNSWFRDTERRQAELSAAGLHLIGLGVSGGEEGARRGPALMPGGSREAYAHLAPALEAIAAVSDAGPCVTYVGPGGAGHFVKMVHNGIEYADMQAIAESYDLLRRGLGLPLPRVADIFAEWNRGPLASFLIEITAQILRVKDSVAGGHLIDHVVDAARQKGTGQWTVQAAFELDVPVPSITAAIDARLLSALRAERLRAAEILPGPIGERFPGDPESQVPGTRDALYAARTCAYAQGFTLMRAASGAYGWELDLKEIARIWKAGCILRARFLDAVMHAYEAQPDLVNLLLDPAIVSWMESAHDDARAMISHAVAAGIPVPAMSAGLTYFDSYRSWRLPQNLTQAQRDAFGAHGYRRIDDEPEDAPHHTEWLGRSE